MNPSSGNNYPYGHYNPAPASQESSAVYSSPQEYYQQQFNHTPYQHSGPMNNPGQLPNMPRMMGTGGHQPFQPSSSPAAMQQPNSTTALQQAGGIQYFMDAACTVPAGSLPHQPQALSQFSPQQQQRFLMSQQQAMTPLSSAQPVTQSATLGGKESPRCVNPNCGHCCVKPQTAPATGVNIRRQ
nr:activating signal cointegrator 1 complex subunit 2 homolog [Aedes albopictus]